MGPSHQGSVASTRPLQRLVRFREFHFDVQWLREPFLPCGGKRELRLEGEVGPALPGFFVVLPGCRLGRWRMGPSAEKLWEGGDWRPGLQGVAGARRVLDMSVALARAQSAGEKRMPSSSSGVQAEVWVEKGSDVGLT